MENRTLLSSLVWNPQGGSKVWDHSIPNWLDSSNSTQVAFNDGDDVTFNDSGAGTVVIEAGGVQPASTTFDSSQHYTINGGSLTGSGNVLQHGSGTTTFSASQSYTGTTTIDAGEIEATVDHALGSGAILIAGGTLLLNSPWTSTPPPGMALTLPNDINVVAGAPSPTIVLNGGVTNPTFGIRRINIEGTISVPAATTLLVHPLNDLYVLDGNWVVNGTVENDSSQQIRVRSLSGTGSIVGSIALQGGVSPGDSAGSDIGTLTVRNIFGGGWYDMQLDANGDQIIAGGGIGFNSIPVNLNNSAQLLLSGSAPLDSYTIIDNVSWNPVSGTFSGLPEGASIEVNGKTFYVTYQGGDGNDVVLSTTPNPNPMTGPVTWSPLAGSTVWDHTTPNWIDSNGVRRAFLDRDQVTFGNTGAGTITIDAGGVNPFSVRVNSTSQYQFIGGPIGGGNLIKLGTGLLIMNQANAYLGITSIGGGTLRAIQSQALGSGTIHGNTGSILYLSSTSPITLPNNFSGAFSWTITLDDGTIGSGGTGLNGTHSITGAVNFNTEGQTITSFNGYGLQLTNPTIATTGTVVTTARFEIVGQFTVNGLLSGTGRVNGLTVVTSTGTISPGVSGGAQFGTFNASNVQFQSGSTYTADLNTASTSDRLNITGSATLTGANLVLRGTASLDTYVLISKTGVDPVTGTFNGLPEGATTVVNGKTFAITYHGGDGNDVVLDVNTLAPTLTPQAATGVYGGSDADLTATLTDQGVPVANQPISFLLGTTSLGSAVTDLNGVATLNIPLTMGIGVYTIQAIFSGSAEYTASSANLILTVNRAPLTIAADPASKTYGQTATPTGTVVGIQNGDDIDASFSSDGDAATAAVGSYPISAVVSGDKLTNYSFLGTPIEAGFEARLYSGTVVTSLWPTRNEFNNANADVFNAWLSGGTAIPTHEVAADLGTMNFPSSASIGTHFGVATPSNPFMAVFSGLFVPPTTGTYTFSSPGHLQRVSFYMDLDGNGVFNGSAERPFGGAVSTGITTYVAGSTGAQVSLIAGQSYRYAFALYNDLGSASIQIAYEAGPHVGGTAFPSTFLTPSTTAGFFTSSKFLVDAGASLTVNSVSVDPETIDDDLQSIVNTLQAQEGEGSTYFVATNEEQISAFLDAVAGLQASASPVVTIELDAQNNSFSGQTVSVPPGIVLIINGATFTGQSPSLTILSGDVIVMNSTLSNSTAAPTILVQGGTLKLRNNIIEESDLFAQAAIQIDGGNIDLGSESDLGGNTINVNGSGVLFRDNRANPVALDSQAGNTFWIDGNTFGSTGALQGLVWVDFNNDGSVDFGEQGVDGIAVTLDGIDTLGHYVHLSTQTDSSGIYTFGELWPGTYAITEGLAPATYVTGKNTVGTLGGSNPTQGLFSDIVIGVDQSGFAYNFGVQPAPGAAVSKGQSAGIGFWSNKKGQALIASFAGVGDWLAVTMPHTFGTGASSGDLFGMTPSEVATIFLQKFVMHDKLDAQVMATALNVFATNSLLGGSMAGAYGFQVSQYGLGNSTWNIGSSGAAFGVSNGTTLTILEILQSWDQQTGQDTSVLRLLAKGVFGNINSKGGL